jgi:putative membrane protein insertion efficiency factor
MRRTLMFVALLPRNVCVIILSAYRSVISPLYGDVCRYYPSCSYFTLQAIQRYGVIRGSWMGIRRIARCHPWAEGGIDDVPARRVERYSLTRFGFVVANGQGKG